MDLTRPLEPKYKYDKYFPKVSCEPEDLGYGYTDHGVKQMAKWAKKYSFQIKKIAELLTAGNLMKTLENDHSFIFNNFQYLPDHDEQHIQSPACAWQMREKGINCKGYSTIASSILLEQLIPHYIRRVSYDGKEFTHVFVVVPTKTKEIIIDGTLPQFDYTTEYLLKEDYKIMPQKLKYIGLNNPGTTPDKERLINALEVQAEKYGVLNTSDIAEFIRTNGNQFTLFPTGIYAKETEMFLPFEYKGVQPEVINQAAQLTVDSLLQQGLNNPFGGGFGGGARPFGGGAGSFGYDTGTTGNFGVDLNLGGGSVTDDIGEWVELAGNIYQLGSNIYHDINGDNNGQVVVVQPGGPTVGQNHGGYQNGGITGGVVTHNNQVPYQGSPQGSPQAEKTPFYKQPAVIVGGAITILAIGYAINKKSKK